MPTAPSFQNFTLMTEPFYKKDKLYIKVQNPKTKTIREVRWYSDSEYAKTYGKQEQTNGFVNLKQARGFSKGPILCVRNVVTPIDLEWLQASIARYAVGIEWYFTSTDVIPSDVPAHFKLVPLDWEEFCLNDDFHMKDFKTLATIIKKKAAIA